MTLQNASDHWYGTPPVRNKKGLSAHRFEFEGVLDLEGRPVATDPSSYAALAKTIALMPLSDEGGKRVMEYTYRSNGSIRIAKYDESTNILVRVEIKSAIITMYRMFSIERKRIEALPLILGPSEEGMGLFLDTHRLETQTGSREIVR